MNNLELFKNIDWKLLRQQKAWLYGLYGNANDDTNDIAADYAYGLVSMINAIQDAALSNKLATEKEIFG